MSKKNNCASFYVVVTVIQIMGMTQGTALLEQSTVAFHCHICFISQSEVKFLCGIGLIVVEVSNSTYVVLIIKYVFILKMVCFLCFFETYYITMYTAVEKVCDIKYCVIIYTALV